MEIQIPHRFSPRAYQIPFLAAMDSGKKRAAVVWHRRSGKDKTFLNFMIKRMLERVGSYYYLFPTKEQAKKVIWEGIDRDGMAFLDHFPKEIVANRNDTEKKIKLRNGSIFQIGGTDDYDSLMGTNPVGIVFSEYSLQNPKAWDFFRPILAENGGWAVFNFTPRGMNHAHNLLALAKDNPDAWFSQILTVDDTHAISQEAIEEERSQGMPEELIQQEFYCKFIEGAGQFFRRIHQNKYPMSKELPPQGDFQLGVDLAKYQDWTVITPFNLNYFFAYPQDRFNQIDWNLQKARIEIAARKFMNPITNETALVWPDATGVGDPIVEDLKNRGLRIGGDDSVGFKFTETSRYNLLKNLSVLLEQDRIKIPDDEGLIAELEAFRWTLPETGNRLKLGVPDGMTDDRVMSLALSVWGVTMPIKPDYTMINQVERNRMDNAGKRSFR